MKNLPLTIMVPLKLQWLGVQLLYIMYLKNLPAAKQNCQKASKDKLCSNNLSYFYIC